jgi:hypothetical protein
MGQSSNFEVSGAKLGDVNHIADEASFFTNHRLHAAQRKADGGDFGHGSKDGHAQAGAGQDNAESQRGWTRLVCEYPVF